MIILTVLFVQVEMDAMELLSTIVECVERTVENLRSLDIDPADIKAIGITNQRETTIVWDRLTGKPLHPAIGILFAYIPSSSSLNNLLSRQFGWTQGPRAPSRSF